ncbi:MAG: hypothetical protein H6837_18200 [Planctomycetes bacterium]|nr:hypothetical protein [Planctomycetota bacterium]
MTTTRFELAPEIATYQDVPLHRRRWFFVTLALFFVPAVIAIAATGPLYAQRDGEVVRYSDSQRRSIALGMSALLVVGLAKAFLR